MAVLHLQFDIDSELHPELHDMLCSIGGSRSQAERLRQLAATGLLWERLRLQAYGRFEVPDLGFGPAAGAPGGSPLTEPAPAAAAAAVRRADATAVQSADLADFVDLSDDAGLAHQADPGSGPMIDGRSESRGANDDVQAAEARDGAVPTAAPLLPPRAGTPEPLPLHEFRSAVQEFPVLTEVVASAELLNLHAITAANGASPVPAHGGTVSTGAQIHELVPLHKTASRSRLLRMKEKGLFKNE